MYKPKHFHSPVELGPKFEEVRYGDARPRSVDIGRQPQESKEKPLRTSQRLLQIVINATVITAITVAILWASTLWLLP